MLSPISGTQSTKQTSKTEPDMEINNTLTVTRGEGEGERRGRSKSRSTNRGLMVKDNGVDCGSR